MNRDCGGCQGLGAHWKWCEVAFGRSAHMLGRWSQAAESLGDSVGPNEYGAANHLWAAAGLLRAKAEEAKARHLALNVPRERPLIETDQEFKR